MNSFRKICIAGSFSVLLLAISSLQAQDPYKPTEPIPMDTSVTYGKFANGLTYYLKVNHKPEKRAELRLVVRAGSVLEDDDQQGLAHLCEHMAFNGTKSYPGNEIVSLLESEGVRLGPDVNAYTSFDQTVYELQIPTDADTIVNKAFNILGEWADAVTYDSTEIQKERGVVVEEWRLGRGASMRVFDKQAPTLFYDSRYAKRIVIGKKDVIEHAPDSVIRKFYHDWYRPDLMAVVVVGDFDKATMMRLVKEHFADIKNVHPERKRVEYTLPDHTQTLVTIATDKELTYSSVQMYFMRNEEIQKTFRDYRENLVSQLYDMMLNLRIQERLQQPNPPIVYGGTGDGPWLDHRDVYSLYARTNDNAILQGFEYMLTEAYRAKEFGFTTTELARAKAEMFRQYESALKERDKTESRSYAAEYLRNFLQQEPIPGIQVEYNAVKEFLPGITLEEINKLADVKMPKGNRVIAISAPEKAGVTVPTKEEVLAVVKDVESKKLEPYVDKVSNQPLITIPPKPGTIVSEKKIASLGVTEWKLSNGARVVLKPTDFKNDEILFSAYSDGGTSLSPDSDYVSAWLAAPAVDAGGVGNFDAISLGKMLSGKIVNVSPTISQLSEGFSGSCSPQDLETLFQLTYLYATSPRKDTSAFGALLERWHASIRNRSASPEGAYYDTLAVTMAQYNYRARPLTEKLLDEINLNKAYSFYKNRFADMGDFTFFFVGNFKMDTIKPYVEEYLASLPTLHRKEVWRDVGIEPPKGIINKEVDRGVEPKSLVTLEFTGPFDWTLQNRYDLSSLIELANIKLREVIREEMSGAYSIGANASPSKYPKQEYQISVRWGCDPTRVDELVKSVMVQLDSLKLQPPPQSYVDKVKEIQRRRHEINLKENRYWLSNLRSYYFDGENPEQILDYDKLIDGLTPQAIQAAAKKYFDMKNVVKVVLKPEKE